MTNTGGKPKYLPPIEEAGKQGSEKEQSKDKTEKTEEKKVKEFGKTQKSIRNLILAFIVSFVSFLPVWVAMHFANIDIPMPSILENKTSFPIEDWKFWSDLIVSLTFAAIVLLASNAVAEEKNKWTNGISWALICILFCWLVGYYGYFRKVDENSVQIENSNVYAENPFGNKIAFRTFLVDEGELTPWVDWPVGFHMKIWGNRENIIMILEDGTKIPYTGGPIVNLPDPGKNTRIRVLSRSDNQTAFFYRERMKK